MRVLIKTMTNLPEHCYDCPCHDGESGYCQADKGHRYCIDRPPWCPLLQMSNESEIVSLDATYHKYYLKGYEAAKKEYNYHLKKIRAEIDEHVKINQNLNVDRAKTLCWCLDVIDKYMAKRSGEECGTPLIPINFLTCDDITDIIDES